MLAIGEICCGHLGGLVWEVLVCCGAGEVETSEAVLGVLVCYGRKDESDDLLGAEVCKSRRLMLYAGRWLPGECCGRR